MTRTSSTDLKTHLGRYLRAVQEGEEIIVTDRERPVARLVPYRAEGRDVCGKPACRPPALEAPALEAPAPGELTVKGICYDGPDTTEILRKDRERR